MPRCVFCDGPLCAGLLCACYRGGPCPQDEDAFYVYRGTPEDSRGPDDPVAHVSCIALALIREPGCWSWWTLGPEPDESPESRAALARQMALLRSLAEAAD
jgi:hypothetical protein